MYNIEHVPCRNCIAGLAIGDQGAKVPANFVVAFLCLDCVYECLIADGSHNRIASRIVNVLNEKRMQA